MSAQAVWAVYLSGVIAESPRRPGECARAGVRAGVRVGVRACKCARACLCVDVRVLGKDGPRLHASGERRLPAGPPALHVYLRSLME